ANARQRRRVQPTASGLGCGSEPVLATSKNLKAVLNALRRAGVEIEDDGLAVAESGKVATQIATETTLGFLRLLRQTPDNQGHSRTARVRRLSEGESKLPRMASGRLGSRRGGDSDFHRSSFA